MHAACDGASFDENRLDHLIRCMEYNEEYIAQKQEDVGIASMTQQDLEAAGLSKALA
jgi:hypothetical protein